MNEEFMKERPVLPLLFVNGTSDDIIDVGQFSV